MKKQLLTLLFAISTFISFSQVPSYVPTNGLVGYWPFNGNANDEIGTNNGTVNGAGLTAGKFGINNTAYQYTSTSNNYIGLNQPFFNGSQQSNFTMYARVYPNNISNNPNIWGKTFFWGEVNFLLIDDGSIGISWANSITGNKYSSIVSSQGLIQNGQWYDILINYNNSIGTIYINGIAVQTNLRWSSQGGGLISTSQIESTCNFAQDNGSSRFGVRNTGGSWGNYFDGKIDEFGLWNRALTQLEINDLYNSVSCTNPTAIITPQGNTSFCQGGFVNLNATTGTNYTYEWYKDGQLINGATASVYQASLSGNYTVKVIDGVCNATSSAVSVVVNAIPNNGVTVNGNTTFCQGGSTTLTAQGTGSYLWSNGATTQAINVTQSGNYNVVVTQNGCSATSNQTAITVNPVPTATITPQGNTTFCQGGFVNLVASGGSTYQWNTGAQTASFSANQSGTYTVNVFNQYNCQASASQTVTVNSNPTVTLSSIPSVVYKTSAPIQLVGNPTGGTFSGAAVSGSTFTPANASLGQKVISYSYTSQQGCSGSASQTTIVADTVGNVCSTYDTLIITVHFTTGINANTSNSIKFYPNPTNDILNIDNGNYQAMSGYSIKIVSLTGAVIYNQPITTQFVQISMNDFGTTGLYFAQIIDPNNAIVDSKKIVLQ